jgi:hypothetical protein
MDDYKNKYIFRRTKNSNLSPLPEEDPAGVNYSTRKKFLREKTMTKNFFKYKKGVSHYHFGANAHPEMIVYTFLLPCKNDFSRESLWISCEISNNNFLKRYISYSYKKSRRRNFYLGFFASFFSFLFCFFFPSHFRLIPFNSLSFCQFRDF